MTGPAGHLRIPPGVPSSRFPCAHSGAMARAAVWHDGGRQLALTSRLAHHKIGNGQCGGHDTAVTDALPAGAASDSAASSELTLRTPVSPGLARVSRLVRVLREGCIRVRRVCSAAVCIVLAGIVGLGGCGGGGASRELAAGDRHAAADAEGLIVQTAASSDYRSISLGGGATGPLAFTGLYRAWFTRIEYRPPMGWLCGRAATSFCKLAVSRENGSGLHTIVGFDFTGTGGGGTSHSVDYPRWSPGGQEIAASAAGYGVYRCSRDGSKVELIMRTGKFAAVQGIAWAPDDRLFVSADLDGQLDIYYLWPHYAGSRPVRITNTRDEEAHLDVSPDGAWLAWAQRADLDDDWDIYIMPTGGDPATDARVLANTTADEEWPRWSPDGRFIAFVRDGDVYVIDTVTWQERQLTENLSGCYCDWSSDGQYVLYTYANDLYRIPFDGAPGDEELLRRDWGSQPDAWGPGLSRYRVLVGPAGSDWAGNDPPFGVKRPGAVVVTSPEGLRSAVTFAIHSDDTLILTDRTPPANGSPVVCEARAREVTKVLEDNGPGEPKTAWDLVVDGTAPGAALVVFDAESGKVRSVTAMWDQVGSAAAASAPQVALEGGNLVISGGPMRVYDERGRLASPAGAVSRVVLDGRTGRLIKAK